MRFILKSIFWLGLAFALIGPGFNANNIAGLLHGSTQETTRMVTEHAMTCTTLDCLGTHAVVTAGIGAIADMTAPQLADLIPLPRPRPSEFDRGCDPSLGRLDPLNTPDDRTSDLCRYSR